MNTIVIGMILLVHLTLCSDLGSEFLPSILCSFVPSFLPFLPFWYYLHGREQNRWDFFPKTNSFKIYLIDRQLHRFCSLLHSQDQLAVPGNVNLEVLRGEGKEKRCYWPNGAWMKYTEVSSFVLLLLAGICMQPSQTALTHPFLFRASLDIQLWTTFLCDKCAGVVKWGGGGIGKEQVSAVLFCLRFSFARATRWWDILWQL